MEKNWEGKWKVIEGNALPLGATLLEDTLNFSVVVPNGDGCNLLIKNTSVQELYRIPMVKMHTKSPIYSIALLNFNYQNYTYTYEVNDKEFVDPYAKVVFGREIFGERKTTNGENPLQGGFPFEAFDWEEDKQLGLSYEDLIMYQLHVRGFTKHPSSKVKQKGTYAGILDKIPYLKELGVNSVVLLPIVEFDEIMENSPYGKGEYIPYNTAVAKIETYRINYWGYTSKAYYFAPKIAYASNPKTSVTELKKLVKGLHDNGIEIILEMYFPEKMNQSMVQDVLRYWTAEFHIDGFSLSGGNLPITLLATDPMLRHIKLLSDGFTLGEIYDQDTAPEYKNLAVKNDSYLIDIRRFLKGDEEQVEHFARHFKDNPKASGRINFIANHDGFTLMDLYSFDQKHNEANEENNRDGKEYNYSWNCGVEGNTKSKKILLLRQKMVRNALTILILSQGTPMLLSGDEFGNSQGGNNNAYCQDNEISWLNWNLLKTNASIFEYLKKLIQIRKEHPILHRKEEFRTMDYISCGYPDLSFHGTKAWYPNFTPYSRMLGILLCGVYEIIKRDKKSSKPIHTDNFFYFAYNMHWEKHIFDLPKLPKEMEWELLLNTQNDYLVQEIIPENQDTLENNSKKQYELNPRSIAVMISRKLITERK